MADKKSEPRKHHYVPRLLLKNFAAGLDSPTPQTFVFDKQTLKTFRTATSNICAERDFYAFERNGLYASAEEFFSQVENHAAPVIEILLKEKRLAALDEAQKTTLIRFVSIQQTRGVGSRARSDHIGRTVQDRFPELDLHLPFADEKKQKKLAAIKLVFDLIQTQIEAFGLLTAVLFRNETEMPFLIGDEPLVLHNQRRSDLYGNLGIKCPGIEVYLPISPYLLLGYWCPSHRQMLLDGVKKYQMLCFLAARGATELRKSAAEDLAQHGPALVRIAKQLDGIDAGECLQVDDDNVEFFNSLQVAHSERFVMSADGNFSLAARMIEADSKLRDGGARFEIV